MKTESIRVRIDAGVKDQVEAILSRLGLTQSAAVNLLYNQILLYGGLPFDVRIPNAETVQAMEDVRLGRNLTRFDSTEDLFRKLKEDEECGSSTPPPRLTKTSSARKNAGGSSTR